MTLRRHHSPDWALQIVRLPRQEVTPPRAVRPMDHEAGGLDTPDGPMNAGLAAQAAPPAARRLAKIDRLAPHPCTAPEAA